MREVTINSFLPIHWNEFAFLNRIFWRIKDALCFYISTRKYRIQFRTTFPTPINIPQYPVFVPHIAKVYNKKNRPSGRLFWLTELVDLNLDLRLAMTTALFVVGLCLVLEDVDLLCAAD